MDTSSSSEDVASATSCRMRATMAWSGPRLAPGWQRPGV